MTEVLSATNFVFTFFCVLFFLLSGFLSLFGGVLFCFVFFISFFVFTFLALTGLKISPGHFYEIFAVVRLTRDSLAASELFLN